MTPTGTTTTTTVAPSVDLGPAKEGLSNLIDSMEAEIGRLSQWQNFLEIPPESGGDILDSIAKGGHLAVDIAGMLPVIGSLADAVNTGWYALEGDWVNAAQSAVGVLPVLGDMAMATKMVIGAGLAVKGLHSLDNVTDLARYAEHAGAHLTELATKVGDTSPKGILAAIAATFRSGGGPAIPRLGSVGDDLAAAERHLATLPDGLTHPPNRRMLEMIREADTTGRPLSEAERSFLDHELLEEKLVSQGMSQEAAHIEVLRWIPLGSNYSPEVILAYGEWFSKPYFEYWGIRK